MKWYILSAPNDNGLMSLSKALLALQKWQRTQQCKKLGKQEAQLPQWDALSRGRLDHVMHLFDAHTYITKRYRKIVALYTQ